MLRNHCAACSGITVRHAPESLCGIKRILQLTIPSTYDNNVIGLIPSENISSKYLYFLLMDFDISKWASDSSLPSMKKSTIEMHEIPLPDMSIQQSIINELEEEESYINANKALIERFEAKIAARIKSVWEEG